MTRRQRREALEGLLFASPWLLGFLLFTAGPMLASFLLSFTRWNGISPFSQLEWVGSENYARLATADTSFRKALYNTAFYAIFAVPLGMITALSLALLLIPFIPGLRDIPKLIPIHRLVWRDWYRQQREAVRTAPPAPSDATIET